MKDRDYKKLSQEIRDVLLYNQCKTQTILDEIKRIDIPDHNEEDDVSLSEQKRFLEERGISIDVEGILKTERIPESDESIAVPELTWDEIVRTARSSGYKDVKIEDILTPEEIDRANREFDQITEDFKKKTRLTKVDITFLSFAVLLQVLRQYLFTPLTEHVNTSSSEDSEKEYKDQYDKGGKYNNTYYRANKECIFCQKFVPYDAIAGSKEAGIAGPNKGIAGTNHRYYTMGHDPALYGVIGTSNILTNTMTVFDGRTFHIKYRPDKSGRERPYIAEEANTPKMFEKTKERVVQCFKTQLKYAKKKKIQNKEEFKELIDSFVPYAAFIKAKRHLASDNSKNGLPIPFTQLISPEFAKELSEYGFDAAGYFNMWKDAAQQVVGSFIINYIIGALHGMVCKAEYQEDLKFVMVRTKRLLLISNLLATTSNIVVTAMSAIVAAYTGNEALAKSAYKHVDIGGAVITMTRVFSDLTFISAVRDEFISNKLNVQMDIIMEEIDALEQEIKDF